MYSRRTQGHRAPTSWSDVMEKQDELKRSAMRAVVSLLSIPEAEKSPLMSEFQTQISSNQELAAIFDSIQRDSSSANMESMDTS